MKSYERPLMTDNKFHTAYKQNWNMNKLALSNFAFLLFKGLVPTLENNFEDPMRETRNIQDGNFLDFQKENVTRSWK